MIPSLMTHERQVKVLTEWLMQRVDVNAHGCWVWKKVRKGRTSEYASMKVNGRKVLVHRAILDAGPDERVCRTCDNDVCVNPDHLFKTTVSGAGKFLGARGRGKTRKKMTAEQVMEIRDCYDPDGKMGIGGMELAKMYGVSRTAIQRAVSWKTFRNLPEIRV